MISVTILTKNSAKYLKEVLDSVQDFDEILLLDNGSTDRTFEIAEKYKNVVVHHTEFIGFGPLHNMAVDLAKNDWILSLDSDEVVTPALLKEISGLRLDKRSVYAFPRHNLYNGKHIKWCGWHPDYQVRLFHRMSTGFTNAQVHEGVITNDLEVVRLSQPVRHYSYECTADFLKKMQSYSELFAEQNRGKKQSSLSKAIIHGTWAFLKSYIGRRGFLGGREGFIISVYNANTAFYKYLKLAGL